MNTVFHLLDDEFKPVAAILFMLEPDKMVGEEPYVGKVVWLGPPFGTYEKEVPYEIVAATEEEQEKGKACVLKMKPRVKLNG